MSLKPCPYRQVDDEGHILCAKIKSGDREVSPNVCRVCPVSAINCAHLRATLDHQTRPPITVRYGNGKTEVWEDDAPSISLHRAACAIKVTPILSPRDCAGCPLRQALIAPDAIAVPAAQSFASAPSPETLSAEPAIAANVQATIPVTPTPARRTAARPARTAPPAPALAAAHAQVDAGPGPAAAPARTAPPPAPSAAEQQRSSMVAKKIIQLQEWLEKQKTAPAPIDLDADADIAPRRAVVPSMRPAPVSPPPPRVEEKRVGWTD